MIPIRIHWLESNNVRDQKKMTKVDNDIRKWETSYVASGDRKQYSHFAEQFASFLES